jgi:hypothetical protein
MKTARRYSSSLLIIHCNDVIPRGRCAAAEEVDCEEIGEYVRATQSSYLQELY